MAIRYSSIILFLFAASFGMRPSQTAAPSSGQNFTVSGEVKLFHAGSNGALRDLSNVVVWLSPQGTRPVRYVTAPGKYRMVQRNKTFEPGLLVVPMGSLVDFPNLDPWFHNVFSLYRGKRFDLGLYEAGSQKTIKFDRPGASYIFCNIHPEMAAVILTIDSDLYGVSDKSGRLAITRVPQGKYLLHVWYENASPSALQALERPVEIDRDNSELLSVSIQTIEQSDTKHKNKYGRDYDPKAGATDY